MMLKKSQSLFSYAVKRVAELKQCSLASLFQRKDIKVLSQNDYSSLSMDAVQWLRDIPQTKFNTFEYSQIRICPQCTTKHHIHLSEWQIPTTLSCEMCGSLLEDSCSHCSKLLSWMPDAVRGICTEPGCSIPIKRRAISPLLGDLSSEQIYDCLLAYMVYSTYKKGDLVFDVNAISSINQAVNIGFDLLCEKSTVDSFMQECFEHYYGEILPQRLYQFPFRILISKLKFLEWPIFGYEASVSNTKRKYINVPTHKLYMSVSSICDALNISNGYVTAFDKFNMIKPRSGSRITKTTHISLSKVIEKLLLSNKIVSPKESLREAICQLKSLNIDPVELVYLWLQGYFKFDWVTSFDILSSIYIESEEFKRIILNNNKLVSNKVIDFETAKLLLNVGEGNLMSLIKSNVLQARYIDGEPKMRLVDVTNLKLSPNGKRPKQTLMFG